MSSSKKKTQNKQRKSRQGGGGASDYSHLWHAPSVDPAQLSRFTLRHIDQAPIFNPLQTGTIIPTGTSGVIPTGTYLDAVAPLNTYNSLGPPVAQVAGGKGYVYYVTKDGKEIANPWIAHVFKTADKKGISFAQALKDPDTAKTYVKPQETKKISKFNICLHIEGLKKKVNFKDIDKDILFADEYMQVPGGYEALIYVPEVKKVSIIKKLAALGLDAVDCTV